LAMIPQGASIGIGDSVTLIELGIMAELRKQTGRLIFDPFLRDEEGDLVFTGLDRLEVLRKALLADVFLTGTNAITLDGKIVNTDGVGNRVAAMIFGPKKVIIVVGANKIVRNVDEAVRRIREVAAPLNVGERLGL